MTKFAIVIGFETDDLNTALAERNWVESIAADHDLTGLQHVTLHKDMRPTPYPFPPFTLVNTEASSPQPSAS